jgi:dienelactone hydrolase
MPLGKIRVPVLVVHHEQDGCSHCPFSEVPALMSKLGKSPRAQLLTFMGGGNRGDPCEAFAYHGFNGLEGEVIQQTVAWILAK